MSISKEVAEQMQQRVNAGKLRYKQRGPETDTTVGERMERGSWAATAQPKRTKTTTKQKGESANSITANVVRCINMQPKCVAYRINNVGIWDEKKQIHRRANTQKGIFDVSAIIRGRAAWFEIKAGYDKPSQDQLIFQKEVIRAGGIAEFVRSTDEFQKLFTIILLDL